MTQTIVITGAGSGIGRATAHKFLAAGWNVGLIGRRVEALVETAADHPSALVLPCDVTVPEQVEVAFAQTVATFGRVDALFNNAGMSAKAAPIDEIPLDTWFEVMNVNLNGMYLCARAAFGQMRRQDPQGGRIINNGSISAHTPRPCSIAYAASKSAITGLTRGAALDGRALNIAVGQIDIGNVASAMTERMAAGVLQADGSIRAEARMDMSGVASTFMAMVNLPLESNIFTVTVMATGMPYVGRG